MNQWRPRCKPVNLRPGADLNHLWQRVLLAFALIVGLVIGVATTVFGYSNLATVDVHWSVFHLNGIPLWTVAVVPLALVLIAGTLYHWMDGLHHFTEHMRHRRRVHELEAEVASLRAHLDQLLEMPEHSTSKPPDRVAPAALPAAGNGATDITGTDVEPAQVVSSKKSRASQRNRLAIEVADGPSEPAPEASDSAGRAENGHPAETGDAVERES